MTFQEKDFYRVKEICAYLNISRQTLWKYTKNGTMPQLERFNARVAGYSRDVLHRLKNVVNG